MTSTEPTGNALNIGMLLLNPANSRTALLPVMFSRTACIDQPHTSHREHEPSRRRQYQSCDQCRKGKRACDAATLHLPFDWGSETGRETEQGRNANATTRASQDDRSNGRRACTNCFIKGRNCTFQWVRSARQANIRRRRKTDPVQEQPRLGNHHRQSIASFSTESSTSWPSSNEPSIQAPSVHLPSAIQRGMSKTNDQDNVPMMDGNTGKDWWPGLETSGIISCGDFIQCSIEEESQNRVYNDHDEDDIARPKEGTLRHTNNFTSPVHNETTPFRPRHRNNALTPFIEHDLAGSANQYFITESLFRVYGDSMENALTCWLTERTCPYVGGSLLTTSEAEIGTQWSNRIFRRVCQLDRASAAVRGRPFSSTEENLSTRALYTAILAFSTQWAQSKDRCPKDSDHEEINSNSPSGFERLIQETCWQRARQALVDSAEVESFRVIFANIIFSLTQKPASCNHTSTSDVFANNASPSELAEIESILDSQGPPIFLEIAMRQLFSYRCKLERVERQAASAMHKHHNSRTGRSNVLNLKDRQTFDLLFWLGVMFDTLSSAMNQRPLIVSDEDSEVLAEVAAIEPTYANHKTDKVWGQLFLLSKISCSHESTRRWPCSTEEAATILSDAAPVKVLLFRKVTRLQMLLSRQERNEKIEEAIADALKVYRYWNDTYGQFFRDCIANHSDLPPRIQSWYFVLAGHWHLAGLLLADLVESIDDCMIGLESQSRLRSASQVVSNLRKENACTISELGRCSSSCSDASFSTTAEFHFAMNQGALLTEPWTAVLIRSFVKAGCTFYEWLSSNGEIDDCRERCEYCIEALWYLGRKSDMATALAAALSLKLKTKIESLSMRVFVSPGFGLDQEMFMPELEPLTPESLHYFLGPHSIGEVSDIQ